MVFNIIRTKRYSKGWLAHISTATTCCNARRKILQFEQENEPTEIEIIEKYNSLYGVAKLIEKEDYESTD